MLSLSAALMYSHLCTYIPVRTNLSISPSISLSVFHHGLPPPHFSALKLHQSLLARFFVILSLRKSIWLVFGADRQRQEELRWQPRWPVTTAISQSSIHFEFLRCPPLISACLVWVCVCLRVNRCRQHQPGAGGRHERRGDYIIAVRPGTFLVRLQGALSVFLSHYFLLFQSFPFVLSLSVLNSCSTPFFSHSV